MASLWKRIKAAVSIGNNDSWSKPDVPKKPRVNVNQLNQAMQSRVSVGVARPAQRVTISQPQPQQSVSMVKPVKTPTIQVGNSRIGQSPTMTNAPGQIYRPDNRHVLSRAFDQVNILDNNRSWKQATPTQTKSTFQQVGQAASQTARGMVRGTARGINTGIAQGRQVVPTIKQQVAARTNNPIAYQNASRQVEAANNRFGKHGGILDVGTYYNADEARRGDLKTGLRKIGGGIAEAGLEIASMGTGGVAGKKLVDQGLRRGLASQTPTIAKNIGINSAQSGVAAANDGATRRDIAKAAAIGGGLGAVTDIGAGIVGSGVIKGAPIVARKSAQVVDDVVNPKYAGLTEKQLVRDPSDMQAIQEYLDMLIELNPGPYSGRKPGDVPIKTMNRVLKQIHDIEKGYGLDLGLIKNSGAAGAIEKAGAYLDTLSEAMPQYQRRLMGQSGHTTPDSPILGGVGKLFKDKDAPIEKTPTGFGKFNKIDTTKPIDNPVIGRFEQKMGVKGWTGLTFKTSDNLNTLSGMLKRAGHKTGVTTKDFGGAHPLTDVIDNPVLFEKYPKLKDITVVFADFHTPKKYGMATSNGDTIFINSKLYEKNPEKLNGTIVHEVQHVKQDIRGMKKHDPFNDKPMTYAEKYQSEWEVDARRKQQEYMDWVESQKAQTQIQGAPTQKTPQPKKAPIEKTPKQTRPYADLQKQIEDAHNAGDAALRDRLISQLPPEMQSGMGFNTVKTNRRLVTDPETGKVSIVEAPKASTSANQKTTKYTKGIEQNPQVSTQRLSTSEAPNPRADQTISSQKETPYQQKMPVSGVSPRKKTDVSPYEAKVQLKQPIVNDGKRAISGADRTTYGLRDSFDENTNVPQELKDVLGAFGNERTVKSNKELWGSAQQRVGTDPAGAMKYFNENSNDEAVATGYALINRYMKNGQTKEAGEIAITMAERALESGRTTQAYSLMKKLTPEGAIQYVENKVLRFKNQNPKMADKVNWTDAKRKQLYEMADQLNSMSDGRERNLKVGEMQQLIDNIFPSSKWDKAMTVWKAGLLTSLRTHQRNILGNTINAIAERFSALPGSFADQVMSLRTGERQLVNTAKGNLQGAKIGGQIAKDQLKTGIDVTNSNLKYNLNHVTWDDTKVQQALKKYTEVVFRPLGAEDKLFKESARMNSLYNQAIAKARNKGLSGADKDAFVEKAVKSPTAKMMDIAEDDAGRATFTHENVLADMITTAKRAARNKSKAAGVASDFLMPFTQVPSGVASQLYAYSPAKLAKSMYDIGKVLIIGDKEIQRKVAQGFGRSVTGTSILGAGAYLYSKGLLTGQPKDDAEKAQWEAEGKQANAMKVGNRWYSLNSVGPQTILLNAGAQYQKDRLSGENANANLAANMGKNLKDQTFLKGMSSALDAIDDPKRYATNFVEGQATSVVPNIVKDVARATDPNQREARGIGEKLKQSIPTLSNDLPKRYDSYGKEIRNSGALELTDMFNSSKEIQGDNTKYIDALRNATGTKDHVPAKVDKTITINGQSKKLTSKEYSDYQQYVGGFSSAIIDRVGHSKEFLALPTAEQAKRIDSLLQDVNTAAKIKLFGHAPKSVSASVQAMLNGEFPYIDTQTDEQKAAAKAAAKTAKKTSTRKSGSSRQTTVRARSSISGVRIRPSISRARINVASAPVLKPKTFRVAKPNVSLGIKPAKIRAKSL